MSQRAADPPKPIIVQVLLPGRFTRPIVLDGRVARLIAWLVQRRQRIEQLPTGSIVFNLGPKMLRPELHEVFPPEPAVPESPVDEGPIVPPG